MGKRIGLTDGRRRSARGRQAGFSMIEVLIATVLFMIIGGAVYGLLEVGRHNRDTTIQRTHMLQNARIALEMMGRDALNAGVGYPNEGARVPQGVLESLLDMPADSNVTHDHLTPVLPGDNLNLVNGALTDQISFVFMDDSFNDGNSLGIASRVSSGSSEVNLQAGQDNSLTQVGDLYILSSSNGSTLGWLTGQSGTTQLIFAGSDPLGINQPGSANGSLSSISYPASAYKVTWVTYLVDANGTLIRREYGNPSARAGVGAGTITGTTALDMPLAQGVENMQIEYVMSDGTVDEAPAPTLYQNIRQVRLTLVVRSPELDAQGNPINVTVSSTYSTRNLGYEER